MHHFNFKKTPGFIGDLRRYLALAAGFVALALAQLVQAQEPVVPSAPVPAANDFYQLVNSTGGKFKDENISWTVEGNVWHTLAEAKSLPPGQKHNGRVRFKLTDPATGETYEDFIEWAQNGPSWYGNTSQVDAFVIPLTLELFDASGQSSKVGINQSRAALFDEFKKEAPPEFQACVIGDKKIVSPHQADMGKGKPYADYFQKYIDDTWAKYATETKTPDGWTGKVVDGALIYTPPEGGKGYTCKSKPTTEQALLGTGPLGGSPQFCSAINRHVLDEPSAFTDASKYYQTLPYNFYAKFWHEHTVNGKAYGFCYDDFNQQDTLIHYQNSTKLVITLYWDTPPPADPGPMP